MPLRVLTQAVKTAYFNHLLLLRLGLCRVLELKKVGAFIFELKYSKSLIKNYIASCKRV